MTGFLLKVTDQQPCKYSMRGTKIEFQKMFLNCNRWRDVRTYVVALVAPSIILHSATLVAPSLAFKNDDIEFVFLCSSLDLH